MPVNTSTNTLITKFIFGNDKNPQEKFNYRFMGDLLSEEEKWVTDETLNDPNALRMGALTDDEYSIRFVLLEIEHRWHSQLEQIVKEVFEEKIKRHKEEQARNSLEPNSK